ncbi:MAG: metallophosphoesterase [Candidatus Obscuribacterales bacterium]|nr:metallophosphoesterase [Candidatus Obscuribacterales bacterium]
MTTVSKFGRKEAPAKAGKEKEARVFLVSPYLQLGQHFHLLKQSLEVVFHSLWGDLDLRWSFSGAKGGGLARNQVAVLLARDLVKVHGQPDHYRYRFLLNDNSCPAGAPFRYEVLHKGKVVFAENGRAPPAPAQSWRLAVVGDIGDGSPGSLATAAKLLQSAPNLVLFPGDLVYDRGRFSEYQKHFFPVFNAQPEATSGAALLCQVPSVAAAGNHDLGTPRQPEELDWKKFPDAFAYYLFWSQPLSGPSLPGLKETLYKRGRNRKKLTAMYGNSALDGSSFHFRFGMVHFIVLDANRHMDWSNEGLRAWLAGALAAGADADFRIVSFHQPPFNSDSKYKIEQRMRLICDLLEEGGCDLVFSGHSHLYERTYPLRFTPAKKDSRGCAVMRPDGQVPGRIELDKGFSDKGVSNEDRPGGVIYVVSGAGGTLVDAKHLPTASQFTKKLNWQENTYTVIDFEPGKLVCRQLNLAGAEIDRFELTKRR